MLAFAVAAVAALRSTTRSRLELTAEIGKLSAKARRQTTGTVPSWRRRQLTEAEEESVRR